MYRQKLTLIALAYALISQIGARAATLGVSETQSITLNSGWNAIYLNLDPSDEDPGAVFGSLQLGEAIKQVWTYVPRLTSAQFTGSGVSVADFGKEGWLEWKNPKHVDNIQPGLSTAQNEAFFARLNTLGKILPHQAYLVELKQTSVTSKILSVAGEVRFNRIAWTPDAFNYIGFQVNPVSPPTFLQFFEGSSAHKDRLFYKLTAGKWQRAAPAERIESGRGYWIFCRGGSDHQGPVDIKFPGTDQLDFGKTTDTIALDLRNTSAGSKTINVSMRDPSGLELNRAIELLSEGRTNWMPLSAAPTSIGPQAPGVSSMLRLTVDRDPAKLIGKRASTVVIESAGMQFRIPVFAEQLTPGGQINGLWVGNVTINQVSQISRQGAAAKGNPTPAGGEFNMRIVLHAASSGGVKLLKEVSLMRKKSPGPDGLYENVLITRDNLIPSFSGVLRRGDGLVGERISTPFYQFAGTELPVAGSLGLGGRLTGTVVLPATDPTNPFRHLYHPDHIAGREITREIVIHFTGGEGVEVGEKPTQGQRLTGVYTETIFGLVHPSKGDIKLRGTIDLQLASAIDVLNPVQ